MLLKRLIKKANWVNKIVHSYNNDNKKDYYKLLNINSTANTS